MSRKLRVQAIVVKPIFFWDDGVEVEAGPEIDAISLRPSEVEAFMKGLPARTKATQKQLKKKPEETVVD